jgi:hypothetical protein
VAAQERADAGDAQILQLRRESAAKNDTVSWLEKQVQSAQAVRQSLLLAWPSIRMCMATTHPTLHHVTGIAVLDLSVATSLRTGKLGAGSGAYKAPVRQGCQKGPLWRPSCPPDLSLGQGQLKGLRLLSRALPEVKFQLYVY